MTALLNKPLASGGGFDTTLVDQSAWFDGSADYLVRTQGGTSGNRREMIFSFWVQRNETGIVSGLFGSTEPTSYFYIAFTAADKLEIGQLNPTQLSLITTAVFRDTGWYHIVISFDMNQGTASETCKLYVNGEQITAFDTATYTSSVDLDVFVASRPMMIGANCDSAANPFQWGANYLAQFLLLEGVSIQQNDYTIDSFGETYTLGTNGSTWVPKSDAVIAALATTVGGNSYCLTSAIGDGTDASGNGNNFTPTSMSHSANGSANTPSNVYCTLNPAGTFHDNISNGRKTFTTAAASTKWGTFGLTSGKWYWELQPQSTTDFIAAVTSDTFTRAQYAFAATVSAVGGTSNVGSTLGTIQLDTYAHTGTETVGVALDVDAQRVDYYVKGTLAVTIDSFTVPPPYYPAFDRDASGTNTSNVAFEEQDWLQTPPTGYKAINTANLTAPTYQGIDYHNPLIYTGDSTSSRALTGAGFQPDLAWFKTRNAARNNRLTDAVRGATLTINTDNTNAEYTESAGLLSFDADGVTVGNGTGFNLTGETQVVWLWKANGASSPSVAEPGHFSIVGRTGDGTDNTAVAHGMGAAPEFIVAKNRTDVSAMPSWHKDYASVNHALDFSGIGTPVSNNTKFGGTGANAPDATNFYVGTNNETNGTGDNMVYYLWRSVPGVCKVGSYTGNGAPSGTYVDCDFQPRWLLIRRIDVSNDWLIYDAVREPFNNGLGAVLRVDSSAAEFDDASRDLDILATGFKARTINAVINASGGTYIYIAMADVGGGGTLPPIPGR